MKSAYILGTVSDLTQRPLTVIGTRFELPPSCLDEGSICLFVTRVFIFANQSMNPSLCCIFIYLVIV